MADLIPFSCHEKCDAITGECRVCEGTGECECSCAHCGSDSAHDCGHCDGDKLCPEWQAWRAKVGPDGVLEMKQQRELAKKDWQEFLDEQSFHLSITSFKAEWIKMFGSDAPAEAVTQWTEKVTGMAKAAGVVVRL